MTRCATGTTAALPPGWDDRLAEADRSAGWEIGEAIAAAPELLRAMRPRASADATVTGWETGGTPVTTADLASQEITAEAIRRSSRDPFRLVAEENGADPGIGGDTARLVDPLDG